MVETLNLEKAALAWSIPWDTDWVTAVSFVGSGRRLAAGNYLGQILLWDLPDKPEKMVPAPTRLLDGHTNAIAALATTPDGRWLISTSYDRSVRFWDMQATAEEDSNLVIVSGRVAAKSGAGKLLDKPQSVNVKVQKPARVLDAHKEWVRSLALSGDGSRMLTGDDRGVAILWDVAQAKETRRLQVAGWLSGAALSPDAGLGATCEFAHYSEVFKVFKSAARLWDLTTGETKLDLSKECPGVAVARFSPDGKLLALGKGGNDADPGTVFLVDTATGKKVRSLPGNRHGVTGLIFHADGKHLLTCGGDNVVNIWQLADGKLLKTLAPRGGPKVEWLHAMALAADGRLLAAADELGFVQVWSFTS